MTQREEFETFWKENMNVELLPLHRTHYQFAPDCDQQYLCHETNRSWFTWQAAKAQTVSQWIPVSERMPENEGTYFCLGHNGTPFVCLLRNKKYEGYVWLRNTGTRLVDGITHWMPIPSLPEQNK